MSSAAGTRWSPSLPRDSSLAGCLAVARQARATARPFAPPAKAGLDR